MMSFNTSVGKSIHMEGHQFNPGPGFVKQFVVHRITDSKRRKKIIWR
jgi:hypothetical protein